jgi:hypothetical protein
MSEHLISFFRDGASLTRAVVQSLATSIPRTFDKPAIPEILPYLCDRSDQEFALSAAIERFGANPEHPLVCIIHGEETEAHDKFLERLQKLIIPRLLPAQSERAAIQLYHLEWPPSFRTRDEMHRRLETSLSKVVLDSAVGTRQTVNDRICQSLGPIACHSHLISETWQLQRVAGLNGFIQFWNEWPELAVDIRLFVLLFVTYQINKNVGLPKLRRYRSINSEIRETLTSLEFHSFDRITGVVLPELKGPTLSESADWARSNETAKFCDPDALVTALFDYYAEWEALEQSRIIPVRIPTDQLVRKLKDLISRTQLQEERAR